MLQYFLHWSGCTYICMFQPFYLLFNLPLFLLQIFVALLIDQSNLISYLRQTLICIILSKKQTILCPGCHHPIWFMTFFCHKIIDQNTDIPLRTVYNDLLFSKYFPCCINTRYKPLCCCLLISRTSVKLSSAEQPADLFKFQRRIKLSGINTIIFDRIGITDNLCMLQPRYTSIHFILNILRKRTGHSSDIHLIGVKPFRLNKYLMAIFVCKFHNLILNGRTISWTSSLNHS